MLKVLIAVPTLLSTIAAPITPKVIWKMLYSGAPLVRLLSAGMINPRIPTRIKIGAKMVRTVELRLSRINIYFKTIMPFTDGQLTTLFRILKLDIEDERGIGRDRSTSSRAITQLWRDYQLPLT